MSSQSILNNNINNNIHNLTNLNPHYVFNNNEGVMSINIQHKHIYPKMGKGETQAKNKTYNRKIEFVENNKMAYTSESNEDNQSESSSEIVPSYSTCYVQVTSKYFKITDIIISISIENCKMTIQFWKFPISQ